MTEELTRKIVALGHRDSWLRRQASVSRARDAYFAERRHELIAGAVAEGARPEDAVILADACVGAPHNTRLSSARLLLRPAIGLYR